MVSQRESLRGYFGLRPILARKVWTLSNPNKPLSLSNPNNPCGAENEVFSSASFPLCNSSPREK